MRTRTAIVLWTLALVVAIVAVSLSVVASSERAEPAVLAALLLALLALPLAFLLGLLRTRLARGAGTRLLMDVPDEPTTAQAESGLRRALGDPTLRLALWLPEAESYVDGDGRPLEPPPDSDGSITTRIEYDGRPLALMTHDPALLQRPAVLEEVVTAARLALEKDRSLRALRISEARTRALLDAIPDLMFRISADGTYLDYKSPDERDLISPAVLGRRVWDRLPPELAEQVMELARAALAGGGVQTLEYEVEIAGELRNYEGRIVSSGEHEFLMIVREITARKRAEEELRHERDLMQTVVDTAPALLLGVDADGRILRFNRALERLSGQRDGEREDVRGRPFWEVFVAPQDAAEVERCFRAGVEDRSEAEQEQTWLAAGGEAIVSWSQSWYQGEGGADRWLITGRDVTERHRHRAELERERNFLNAIANNAPSLLCLIDETGRVQDQASNVTFERVLDYDTADTGGHVFWERYVPPEDRDDVRACIERVVAGGAPYEHDNWWLTRTGERLLIAWSCTPLPRIDERTLFVISGTDVTERRRQEEEIRLQRDFLGEVGDATPSLLVLFRADGSLIDDPINASTRALTGYAPEEVAGCRFWEVFSPPEAADLVRRLVLADMQAEDAPEHETEWLTRTGARLLIAWRCTRLPAIRGHDVYLVAGTDITERKRQEEEIRRSRARIVEAGDAERRRLERNLHDGAQQRLVAISISLRLAKARVRESPREAEPLLEAAADELALALEELRELARGIHPAVLTDRGLEPALVALASRSPVPVRLDVRSARMPPPVEAAAYYVVSEALANVAKYAGATSVSVRVERVDGRVLVDVRDDGVGGADPERGSGLRGLSDRVSALDGRLRVESPAGAGTLIRAEIPTA